MWHEAPVGIFIIAIIGLVAQLVDGSLGMDRWARSTGSPLLAGGLVAAPIAAWIVRRVDARMMDMAVATMILFTTVLLSPALPLHHAHRR